MTTKMKLLDDGTEISQDQFGRIFGGGMRKALNAVRTVIVDGHELHFTAADLSPLQEFLDIVMRENQFMRQVIGTDDRGRLKLRVKAGSLIGLVPAHSSALDPVAHAPLKAATATSARRPRRFRKDFPTEEAWHAHRREVWRESKRRRRQKRQRMAS